MIISLIILFIIGYLLIALEHPLKVNKATFALIMCGVMWSIYALTTPNPEGLAHKMPEILGETAEILFFLIGAMTIVEHIDRYGGFSFITEKIKAGNKRQLMWILSFVAFFMSAVLDNMTTTIIMVMMIRRMMPDQKERWIFAGVIVLAANAGGAWSPIGDVTTIMLWMADKVTTPSLIANLLVPSLVAMIVPVAIASRWVKKEAVSQLHHNPDHGPQQIATEFPGVSRAMLILGVAGLLFVPIFKSVTHLPPYLGMMFSLGIIWCFTEIVVSRYRIDPKLGGRITHAMRHIDMSTILFFLGILMSVSVLQESGVLANIASAMNNGIHEPYSMATLIGALSSIVDNVPLVAACIKMFSNMDPNLAADYLALFNEDGLFWHLLTFTAGVGGSLLIIGSAAGVVAMGIEKIPFFWYVKKISFIALLGYLAGVACIWIEDFLPFLHI